MPEYYGCSGKFVWPNGDQPEGWEVNWEPKLWKAAMGLRILGLNASPCIYVITHFYVGYVYVMYYYAIITSVTMPCDDPGDTNRPCLREGCHNHDVARG
jgi:hypothetical protein